MSSVNFEKYKQAGEAKAMFKHSDVNERLVHEHSNKQIDKAVTPDNIQLRRSYEETCKFYDKRISELDRTTNTNKRHDRVTLVGMTIPTPKGLEESTEKDWFKAVYELLRDKYGSENVVQFYVHFDEKHEYKDTVTGEYVESRSHAHCYIIPEIEGKLNAKRVVSRSGMMSVNRAIDKLTREQYGLVYMDGTKRKSRAEVEELKQSSAFAEVQEDIELTRKYQRKEAQKLAERKAKLAKREREQDKREENLNIRESALKRSVSDFNAKMRIYINERKKLDTEQSELKESYSKLEDEKKKYKKEIREQAKARVQAWVDERIQKERMLARREVRKPRGFEELQAAADAFDVEFEE